MNGKNLAELAVWSDANPECEVVAVFSKEHCKQSQAEEYPTCTVLCFDWGFALVERTAPFDPTVLQTLWSMLGDTPVNDDGEIQDAFLDFPVGTDREEIWHWFEEHFNVSVADLLKGV